MCEFVQEMRGTEAPSFWGPRAVYLFKALGGRGHLDREGCCWQKYDQSFTRLVKLNCS